MIKLKDVAKISSGQGAPQRKSDYSPNGHTFIKAGDLNYIIKDNNEIRASKVTNDAIDEYKLKLYPSNSIIFAKSGVSCTKNRIYVTKSASYIVNHMCIIYDIDPDINVDWLSLYLENYNIPKKLIKDESYPSITLSDISNINIHSVSLSNQLKIVEKINKIKNLLELNTKELLLLDELVKSRFIEMFGTLENPSQNFKIDILKNLCIKITDGKHGGCTTEEGTKRYFVGAREIHDERVNYDTAPEINITEFEKDYKRCNIEIGDFIIVNTGATIGKSAIATDERTKHTLLQKSVALLKVKQKLLNPVFLKWCYMINKKMYMVKSASAQPNLLLSLINATKIYVPDINLQNEFAVFVDQVDKSKLAVKQSIEKLEILKKSLMQKYFS